MDIHVDSDAKALIVAGDKQMVLEIIKIIQKSENIENSPKRKPKPKFTQEGALLLDNLEIAINLNETETCLEMLVISLCKTLQVKPKQAAGLLTQNGKFLVQVILKGLKGKFEPINNWYSIILDNLTHLKKLITKEYDQGSLSLVLSALKPGLATKNQETLKLCLGLFLEIRKN